MEIKLRLIQHEFFLNEIKLKKNINVYIFYKKDNEDSIYLKYSNYNNKYLNYKKEVALAESFPYVIRNLPNMLPNPSHKIVFNHSHTLI